MQDLDKEIDSRSELGSRLSHRSLVADSIGSSISSLTPIPQQAELVQKTKEYKGTRRRKSNNRSMLSRMTGRKKRKDDQVDFTRNLGIKSNPLSSPADRLSDDDSIEKKKTTKTKKMQKLQDQNVALKAEYRSMRGQVKSLQSQVDDVRKSSSFQISALEIQLEQANRKISKQRQEKSNRVSFESDKEGQIKAMQALTEVTKKQESRIQLLKGDLERRRIQSRLKEKQIQELEYTISDLNRKLTKNAKAIKENEEQIRLLQLDLEESKKEYETLSSDFIRVEKEKKILQDKLNQNLALNESESGKRTLLQRQLSNRTEIITNLEKENKLLNEQLNQKTTKEEEESSPNNLKDLQTELTEKSGKIIRLEKDIQALQDKLSKTVGEKESSLNEGKIYNFKEKDKLQSQLSAKTDRITHLETEIQQLKDRLDNNVTVNESERDGPMVSDAKEKDELQFQLNEKVEKISTLEEEIVKLQNNLNETITEKEIESGEKDELQLKLNKKTEIITNLEVALEISKGDLNDERKKHSSDVEKLKNQMQSDFKKNLSDELEEKEKELRKFREKDETRQQVESNLRMDNDGLNERIGWLMEENDRLRKVSEQANLANSEADTKLEDALNKNSQLSKQVEQLQESNKKLTDEMKSAAKVQATANNPQSASDSSTATKAELDKMKQWAKMALTKVQNLEKDKKEATQKIALLEKKVTSLQSQTSPSKATGSDSVAKDDQSEFSEGTFDESMMDDISIFDVDDDESQGQGSVMNRLFRRGGSEMKVTDSQNGDIDEIDKKVITVTEKEFIVKEQKIKVLLGLKKKHEQTMSRLLQDLMKMRKTNKDWSLKYENVRLEREALEMKVAVLEKEMTLMDINNKTNTYTNIGEQFRNASVVGNNNSSDFVGETAAFIELRVKDEKLSALEKLINDHIQTISSLKSELSRVQKSEVESKAQVEKLRMDNIAFFRRNKIYEKQLAQLKENKVASDEVEGEDGDDSYLSTIVEESVDSITLNDKVAEKLVRDLEKKVKDRDAKILSLKRYNAMMEKTVTSLRKEMIHLRMTLRSEAKKQKTENDKQNNKINAEGIDVQTLEKEFMEFNQIHMEFQKTMNDEGRDDADSQSTRDNGAETTQVNVSYLNDLKNQVSKYKEILQTLEKKMETVKCTTNAVVESFQQDISKIVEEKSTLELDMMRQLSQFDEAKIQLENTQTDLTQVKNQLEAVEEEKLLMEEDFRTKYEIKEKSVEQLETKILRLRELNLDSYEATLKKKKKDRRKKKKNRQRSMISSVTALETVDESAAKILEQMMEEEDDQQGNVNGTDLESDYLTMTEAEETDAESHFIESDVDYMSTDVGTEIDTDNESTLNSRKRFERTRFKVDESSKRKKERDDPMDILNEWNNL